MISPLVLALVPALAPPVQDDPDVVVLKSGDEVACRVLFEDDEKVVYRAKKKTVEVPRADVQSLRTIEQSLRQFFVGFDKIDRTDADALAELALWCESRELLGEARNLWIRILTVAPEDERAWNKLGGVYSATRGWRLKVRGRYYTIEELRERVSDWKNAMELTTAHFLLKTDIPPERALDVTIDLERAYVAFYDLLGPYLDLYVFDEVPEIQVFSDQKNYPSPPTPRQAWFSYSANELYVDASKEPNPNEIVGNLTYCLLYNSFHRTLGKAGSIAPWARRGLAETFGTSVRPQPGQARWELGTPYVAYFVTQATDDKPLSLDKVLTAGIASFDSGTEAHRYIVQSYTLAFFLMYANDGKYREPFAEFLRSSYLGQGSATHFQKIMGVDLEELEAEWTAYVKKIAGA